MRQIEKEKNVMNITFTTIQKYCEQCMVAKLITAIMFICGLGLIGGCAVPNEGKVDFRKSTPKTNATIRDNLKLEYKNFTVSESGKFVPGDSISIHLRTAYIHDFAELANPFRVFTRSRVRPNGEIAITANAFEEETGKELDFKNMEAGRLVFFSDDVFKKQFLNFNNMPIYGPIEYRGGPLALRMSIFELDVNSEQAKAIIGIVAQIGSTAYAPAAPILSALNKIGQGLAGGEQNDTEFRYTMVFDPRGGVEYLNHFTLEAGNYVFIRLEDRQDKIDWSRLSLNENEGIVYTKLDDGTIEEYTDHTYLIVEINKNTSSMDIDLSQSTYSELLVELKRRDKEKAGFYSGISNDLKGDIQDIILPRTQKKNFNIAKELLNKIAKPENDIEREHYAKRFFNMIKASSGKEILLNSSQVEYLTSKLRLSINGLNISVDDINKKEPDELWNMVTGAVSNKKVNGGGGNEGEDVGGSGSGSGSGSGGGSGGGIS